MKKEIEQFVAYFEPLIIVSALIIAMLAQSQVNFFFYWLSFSLLLAIVLWRLRTLKLYFSIVKDKAFRAYSAFIVWGVISCQYWSVVKVNSIIIIVTFLIGLLSYFIGYTESSKQSGYFQKLLMILGLGLTFYTYYQFFILGINRPIGLLLNWNAHSAFLAMVILPWVSRYVLDNKVNIVQSCYVFTIALFFSFAMGLTQSRGVLLIIVAVFISLVVISRFQSSSYKKALLLILSIALGYILSSYFVNETMLQRIIKVTEIETYTAATGSGRHLLWLPAWEMYLDRPFLGWGLGTYTALFAQYKAPLTIERGHYVHNDYLQILLELGPIGLLLFLGFVFFITRRLYYILHRKKELLSKNEINAFALLAPCIGLLVHTFFTFHLYHLSMQIILGYYLGQSSKCMHMEKHKCDDGIATSNKIKFKYFYRITLLILVIISIMSGYSSYHLMKADQAEDNSKVIDHYFKAGLFFKSFDRYDALISSFHMKQLQRMPVNNENLEQRKRIAIKALNAVNIAINKLPLETSNYIVKAEILRSMQGNYDEIYDQYSTALEINPYLLEVRYYFALMLEENRQYKKAMEIMWAGWGLLYQGGYQKGVDYLLFQLELHNKYGRPEESVIIEQQIQRLKLIMVDENVGNYVFLKL